MQPSVQQHDYQPANRSPPHLAFSSTYEIESTFTTTDWQIRLARPRIHTFVAVDLGDSEDWLEAEWVGQVTVLGPVDQDTFELSGVQGLASGSESRWQMNALYVDPQARGRNVAKELIGAATIFVQNGGPAGVRIMIKPDNHTVRGLYSGVGFQEVGRCTLGEALRANGDAELIPEDEIDTPRFNTKGGLVMECVGPWNEKSREEP